MASTETETETVETKWTESHEHLIQKWKSDAEQKASLHEYAARFYQMCFYIIGIASTTFGSASSFLGYSQISSVESCSGNISSLLIALSIIASISTICSGLQTLLHFENTASIHKNASMKYRIIFRDIEEQLVNTKDERDPVRKFFARIKKSFDSLVRIEIILPKYLVHRFLSSQTQTTPTQLQTSPQPETEQNLSFQKQFEHEIETQMREWQQKADAYQTDRMQHHTETV